MGDHCTSGGVVVNEANCKHAANQLSMSYSRVRTGLRYPAGCYRSGLWIVYFNTIVDPSLITNPYSHYGAICYKGMGISFFFVDSFSLKYYFVIRKLKITQKVLITA